jgi:dTDP-4-dehydrorhamnose reductase
MRVLVLGPTGQLGTDVVRVLSERGEEVRPAPRRLADLTDRAAIEALLTSERPGAVVNCAAYHDVAGCEENPELALAVNATGVELLAQTCATIEAKLMTVSTTRLRRHEGWRHTEEDAPHPLNRYGESKLRRAARVGRSPADVRRTNSEPVRVAGPSGKASTSSI